jgi:phosphoribosylanthranilate isomerase
MVTTGPSGDFASRSPRTGRSKPGGCSSITIDATARVCPSLPHFPKATPAVFQVKICGITRVEDALLAAEAGADAIGLNFFEQSPRYVSISAATDIATALRKLGRDKSPAVVGVFVNAEPASIFEAMQAVQLDAVQLHGDEPPQAVATLSGMSNLFSLASGIGAGQSLTVVRAFRCRDEGLASVSEYLCQCEAMREGYAGGLSTLPHAVLLDAYVQGAYGGTGRVVDWAAVKAERELLHGLPIILAGGLTPENVAEAIEAAQPDAVDTASGVESSPGVKDPAKTKAFVAAARSAFAGRGSAA